ncbi:hypothetical protein WJX72_005234 [[Myrmecia] bisecta]|uniref:Secreted protein n=1 Tax=[Myrmecia] bisecta TaxID=41462 RepID=A0AAW1R6Q1_9CHLO
MKYSRGSPAAASAILCLEFARPLRIYWPIPLCLDSGRVEAISEERVVAVLAVLVGGFAAAPRSPVFELCIPGDDRCPILCSDVFEERLFQAQFLPKIQVNVIHNLK